MSRLFFLLLSTLIFSSCTKAPPVAREDHPLPDGIDTARAEPGRRGGVFIQAVPGEPSTFNPLVSEDATSGGFECWEQQKGAVSLNQPATLSRQIAFRGYFAAKMLDSSKFIKAAFV